MLRAGLGATMVLLLGACASIESVPGAKQIALLTAEQAVDCQRLGTASAQVVDKVAFVERDKQKMADELLSLAKNEAVRLGGNGVMPISEIANGTRQFEVYRC